MKKKTRKFFNDRYIYLLLLIISLLNIYRLLLPGFYEPHDLHHIADIYQMYRAFSSGQMPPRWGPDFLYGFGYPLFNFYYVGPFYLGAFFYFIFHSLTFSYKMVFISGVVLGSFGFYLFLRRYFSKLASLTGTVLFAFTPYKAVQIFVRGAMGEFYSMILLPWLLYFTEKYQITGSRKWYLLSVAAAVCIILSHNYFWVLIFGFIGMFYLIRSVTEKNISQALRFFYVIIWSFTITAYWWLPAFVEQKLLYSQTPFPLYDHFPFIKQLLFPSWGYGASVWGPYDGLSFQIGIVNLAVLLFALIYMVLMKLKKIPVIGLWAIIGFFLSLFFMNMRSYFIWKAVPFHNMFQFPWRLLAFTGFFSAVLSGFVVENSSKSKNRLMAKLMALALIFASVTLTLPYFKPSAVNKNADDEYLKRMFAARTTYGKKNVVDQKYINYSEDYLLLPKWIGKKPDFLPEKKFESGLTGAISVLNIREISPISWEAEVDVADEGPLNFFVLYFPGWEVFVDDNKADIYPGEWGQIVVDLSKGKHFVKAKWSETNLRKISDIISLVSVVSLFLYPLAKKKIFLDK